MTYKKIEIIHEHIQITYINIKLFGTQEGLIGSTGTDVVSNLLIDHTGGILLTIVEGQIVSLRLLSYGFRYKL